MAKQFKASTTDSLNEEYYQITPSILESFPSYRPPLSFFYFKEDIGELIPYFRAGQRLSKEKQEELAEYCSQGNIFVARSDHPIYAEHLSKQLDLVLVDSNLKEGEIIEIFQKALTRNVQNFFEQPVQPAYEKLYSDILVFTEYLWQDRFRSRGFLRHLSQETDLPSQAVNNLCVGLTIFMELRQDELKRKALDKMAMGLLLHELGLTKIPSFLQEKTQNLTKDEQDKLQQYPLLGASILQKLGIRDEPILQCLLEHRERMDGSGFPRKLKDKQISIPGRICAVSNAFCKLLNSSLAAQSSNPKKDVAAYLHKAEAKFDPKLTNILQGIMLKISA